MIDWSAIGSAAIGGVLALAGGLLVYGWQAREEKIALREALKSEISSIVMLIETRKFDELIESELKAMKDDPNYQPRFKLYGSDPPWNWPIYEQNAGAIGKVGEALSGDIVRFYTLLRSVQVDMAEITGGRMKDRTDVKKVLEEDLAIWRTQIRPAANRIAAPTPSPP